MSQPGIYGSYLFAFIFWVSLSLGCLALVLMHGMFRAAWGRTVLRLIEAGAATLPLMALLFVPIALSGAPALYPWARPEVVAHDPILQHRALFMNMPFFMARAAAYFLFWCGATLALVRSSRAQDKSRNRAEETKRTTIAAPSMVLFVLTVTFAFTDWVMSTDAKWISTIYGVWFAAGQVLSATALVTIIATRRSNSAPFREFMTAQVTRDLGNLLLAFTMFWTYITLSQFLIIWSGNMPEEITYYITRSSHGWNYLGIAIIVGGFFVPFLLLLSNRTKRTPAILGTVATLILAVRVADVFWIVIPAVRPGALAVTGGDIAAFAGIGLLWTAAFIATLRSSSLVPNHELPVQEVISHA